MGEMIAIPQPPKVQCGMGEKHEEHHNVRSKGAVPKGMVRFGSSNLPSWCDGLPPLEAFVELTIRVPLRGEGFASTSNAAAMKFVERAGLAVFVNYLDHPDTSLVLRVRTQDLVDKVYPVISNPEGVGFKAVEMPANCPTCDSPERRLHPAIQHEGEVQPCTDGWHRW
jgi:hypothetical protein